MFCTAVLAVYAALNIVAFLVFGWEKHKAMKNKWRTPEKILLTLSFLGAFGGLAGMYVFHHKTRRLKFKFVWLFVAFHIATITAAIYFL